MVSIVMATYNRPEQLLKTLESIELQSKRPVFFEVVVVDDSQDDHDTPGICEQLWWSFPIQYHRLNRPRETDLYLNPGPAVNAGIKLAKFDNLLIQNPECLHIGDTIARLYSAKNASFAQVIALKEDGRFHEVWCGPDNPRPFFFCGMIRKWHLLNIGGFDEDYTGYGYEDNDLADRLERNGVKFNFTTIPVFHQWHPSAGEKGETESGRLMYERKKSEPVVRNVGREWGKLIY